MVVTGASFCGLVAEAADRIDGSNDGYLFA